MLNLTYEIIGNGYVIKNNGKPWIRQESFIPYPGETTEESAQNHIDAIIEDMNAPVPPSETEQLRNDLDSAILELTMAMAMQGGTT